MVVDMSEDVTSCKMSKICRSQDFLTIESCYVSTGTGTGKEEVGLWGRSVSGILEHDLIQRPSFHPNISVVIWIMETHG